MEAMTSFHPPKWCHLGNAHAASDFYETANKQRHNITSNFSIRLLLTRRTKCTVILVQNKDWFLALANEFRKPNCCLRHTLKCRVGAYCSQLLLVRQPAYRYDERAICWVISNNSTFPVCLAIDHPLDLFTHIARWSVCVQLVTHQTVLRARRRLLSLRHWSIWPVWSVMDGWADERSPASPCRK